MATKQGKVFIVRKRLEVIREKTDKKVKDPAVKKQWDEVFDIIDDELGIETGVEVEGSHVGRRNIYPFSTLEVGQSFSRPTNPNNLSSSARKWVENETMKNKKFRWSFVVSSEYIDTVLHSTIKRIE